jgi:hypothetical protein
MVFLSITSSGPVITRTTYWQSPDARSGCLYLSTNHETLRILVPPAAEHVLAELPPIGTLVELHRGMRNGRETYRLIWLNDPVAPYVVEIDLRLCDRRWPDDESGTVAALIWYTAGEVYDVRERRRELVQIGDVIAS